MLRFFLPDGRLRLGLGLAVASCRELPSMALCRRSRSSVLLPESPTFLRLTMTRPLPLKRIVCIPQAEDKFKIQIGQIRSYC